MPEIKISALGSATSLTGAEAVPVVQTGTTKKTTTQDIANLLASAVNTVSVAVDVERTARQDDVLSINNVLSGIIAAGGGDISVTSAEAAVMSAQAASAIAVVRTDLAALSVSHSALSTFAHTIAGLTVGVSAQAASALNVASAQAASVANVVSIAVSALSAIVSVQRRASARTTGNVSTQGTQNAYNALSSRISALNLLVSVTSVEAMQISNTASAGNASVMAYLSTISTLSAAGTAEGLQSVVNALSNRISALIVGAGGAQLTDVNAASAQAASAINVVSAQLVSTINVHQLSLNALSLAVSAISTIATNEINNRISAFNVNREGISTVSVALAFEVARALSVENQFSILLSVAALNTFSALSTLANQVSIVDAFLSNLTSSHNVLSNRVSANSATGGAVNSDYVSQAVSALNLVSARTTAAVSVKGLQSAVNALSSRISVLAAGAGGLGATMNDLSIVSAQAASAIAVLNFNATNLSLAMSAVSSRVVSIMAQVLSLETHASTASAAATSADTHANLASAAATSVANLLATLSVTVANALSAGDVISAGIGRPQLRMVTGGINVISATALTKVSGLSISVETGGTYQINAVLLHTHSAQGTNGFGFGISSPAAPRAGGRWMGFTSVVAAGLASANYGYFNQAGFGSITYSATPAASATMYRTELDLLLVNVSVGTVQIKARTSATGVGQMDIQVGSYIQAFRIF